MKHEIRVSEADAGRRLDRWLQSALPDLGFTAIRRLLRKRKVRRNGVRAHGDEVLQAGDLVVLHAPPTGSAPAPVTQDARSYRGPDVEVLEEDDDFLFVLKPATVACSDDGQDERALQLWLRERYGDAIAAGTLRPEPCHRLDRGTTGVLAIAKKARGHESFRQALQAERVEKVYEVAVWGSPPGPRWSCRVPLRRQAQVARDRPRVVAAEPGSPEAMPARTDFIALRASGPRTLLRATLHSGRTHQIRAHCLIEGLAVVHDPRYGRPDDEAGDGPMLHARELHLHLPDRRIHVQAPWPSPRSRWLHEWGLVLG